MATVGTEVLQALVGLALAAWGVRAVATALPALRRVHAAARGVTLDPAAPGGQFGRLTGTAEAPEHPTEAPFSGREVVAFDCAVEEGEDPMNADVLRTERQVVPCRLTVGGATVHVLPDEDAAGQGDAPVLLEGDTTVEVPGGEPPPERIRSYDEWADLAPQRAPVDAGGVDLSGATDRTYREGVVEPGDAVTVYGSLQAPADVAGVAPDDVDAVLDGSSAAFLLTDRDAVDATVRADRRTLLRALLGAAAVAVGLVVFGLTAG
jgi:hypothetical protein